VFDNERSVPDLHKNVMCRPHRPGSVTKESTIGKLRRSLSLLTLCRFVQVASGEDKSGTTAVCALITEKYIIIANCGDSRGVCCTGGKAVLATQVSSTVRSTVFDHWQYIQKWCLVFKYLFHEHT